MAGARKIVLEIQVPRFVVQYIVLGIQVAQIVLGIEGLRKAVLAACWLGAGWLA